MKKEEIEKYCKKYNGLYKSVTREVAYFDMGCIEASELFKRVEKFKKKHKFKDATIEIDKDDDLIELCGERKRTQKEIIILIKELKEQESNREKERDQHKKNAEERELREYKKLHKKYGKK